MRSVPLASNALQPWNWSPGSGMAVAADQVWPPSNDWLTIGSEFVATAYASATFPARKSQVLNGIPAVLRMSYQTTAKWLAFVGSAVMFPAAHERKTLSWYVVRPNAIGKSQLPSKTFATFIGTPSGAPVSGLTSTTS